MDDVAGPAVVAVAAAVVVMREMEVDAEAVMNCLDSMWKLKR